jgi:hypothetical protein
LADRWEVERAIIRSGLSPHARFVALVLLTFADAGTSAVPENFSPSLTMLAACTGLGRSTVARALNELESGGWVTRDRDLARARSEHRPTGYRLRVPASPAVGLVPDGDQPPSATPGLGLVPETTGASPTAGHNQTKRTRPKPDQKKTSARADPYTGLPGFAEFWATYPRRTAKRAAANAYRSALNRGTDPQLIIKAAAAHRDQPGRDLKFTKHPATWLNGDCWLDELEPHLTRTDQRVAQAREAGRRVGEQLRNRDPR